MTAIIVISAFLQFQKNVKTLFLCGQPEIGCPSRIEVVLKHDVRHDEGGYQVTQPGTARGSFH